MDWFLPLIAGLGIGSLVTSVATHLMSRWATKSERLYQEKREAYLGLLDALHKAAVQRSDANAKTFALWKMRCELFGSPAVARLAQAMIDTDTHRKGAERIRTLDELVLAMREDLRR